MSSAPGQGGEASENRKSFGRREVLKSLALAGVAGAGKLAAETLGHDPSMQHPALPKAERWGLQEIVLHAEKEYGNPFKEVQLHCSFVSGSETVSVTGFFDGNSTWKVRFMPPKEGSWTFKTRSNEPSLDGKAGEFEAVAPGKDNHGPVQVAKRFHFSYADGKPFYPLGTTTYVLFHFDRESQVRTLGTLSATAFTKTRILVMPFSSLIPGPCPFERNASGEIDSDRYDVEFFRRYETGLLDLQALGIEADLILFHPYDAKGTFSRMDEAHDKDFIQYATARLAAFRNVWWTLTNEFDLYPQFGIEKNWRALGECLAECDPYRHLRGIHNSCVGFYDNSEEWITHVILQDITLQRLTAEPRNNSAMGLDARKFGKPVVVDEYGYEGDIAMTWGSIAPREAVEMHWSITMAGAYGSHGESYYGTPRGRFVGASPERLAFLKNIMLETPFQDLAPLSEVAAEPNASITVLGVPGVCYLFHFAQPKEKASWNLGFFGPATPSHPLPIVAGAVDPNTFSKPSPTFTIEDGIYRAEMIDIWLMKVHPLGFTAGASQQFRSLIAPGIVRLTRVEQAPPGETVLPMAQIMQRRPLAF
jgi:hypothetical protein